MLPDCKEKAVIGALGWLSCTIVEVLCVVAGEDIFVLALVIRISVGLVGMCFWLYLGWYLAKAKGYSGESGLILFFTGIGAIIVISLPDKHKNTKSQQKTKAWLKDYLEKKKKSGSLR